MEEESDMLPPSVEMDGYDGGPGFPWIPGDFTTPTRRNSFHALINFNSFAFVKTTGFPIYSLLFCCFNFHIPRATEIRPNLVSQVLEL